MGHGAEGKGFTNSECGKSKTKHKTPNIILTLNPKSAIESFQIQKAFNPMLHAPSPKPYAVAPEAKRLKPKQIRD